MASPSTVAFKEAVEARAAVVRAAAQEEVSKTHPSLPRTSSRWIGRTRGAPFRNFKLVTVEHRHGKPSVLVLKHPRQKFIKLKVATPDLLSVFFPALPEPLSRAMLFGQ